MNYISKIVKDRLNKTKSMKKYKNNKLFVFMVKVSYIGSSKIRIYYITYFFKIKEIITLYVKKYKKNYKNIKYYKKIKYICYNVNR